MRSVRSPFVVTATKNSSIWRDYAEFDIDYEEVSTLGEGSFGRVLLVRNRKRNIKFAMKELREQGPDTHREVDLLMQVTRTHPHVVSYIDRFVRTDPKTGVKTHCIMMDYLHGVSLKKYVELKKPVNNVTLYRFLKSALEALAHLHGMLISHRDIKPENYIVATHRLEDDEERLPQEEAVVQRLVTIDLGLGSFLKRGGYLYASDADELVGTPNYNSPQIIDADNAGEKWLDAKADDVWALGATFYFLCMGKPVAKYHSGSWSHSWREVLKFSCPATVWPHDAVLNEVIRAALIKDHTKRPSATELLAMLEAFEQQQRDAGKHRTEEAEAQPKRERAVIRGSKPLDEDSGDDDAVHGETPLKKAKTKAKAKAQEKRKEQQPRRYPLRNRVNNH